MVSNEEWHTLTDVPREMWLSSYSGVGPLLCELEPSHGRMMAFMQTPDHRALALCANCHKRVLEARVKAAKA